jgi:hypothetical protein
LIPFLFSEQIYDAIVKSPNFPFSVIPAKAGTQQFQKRLDAGSRPA